MSRLFGHRKSEPSAEQSAQETARLRAALETEQDWSARNEIVGALGRLGGPGAIDAVVAAADPDAEHRVDPDRAADAIRTLQVSPDELAGHLSGGGPDRRRGAAVLLGRLGEPTATPGLVAALRDPEPTVRAQAAQALGELAPPQAVEPLAGSLDDPEVSVRASAVRALGRIAGGAESVYDSSFHGRINRYSPERRRPEAIPPLLRALDDAHPDARSAVLDALRYVDDASLPLETVDAAVAMLDDDDESLRRSAAVFLLTTRAPGRSERAAELVRQALSGVRRGGMDEPYCSQYCYDEGGKAIALAVLGGETGQCAACERMVVPGQPHSFVPYRPGVEFWVGLHPDVTSELLGRRAKELFVFHQDDRCVATVRAEVSRSPMCVRCGSPLRPSATG